MPESESGRSPVYYSAHRQQEPRAGQTRVLSCRMRSDRRPAPNIHMTLTKGAAENVCLSQNRAREARNDQKWTKSNDLYHIAYISM